MSKIIIIYNGITAKHKEDIICYVGAEVVLCR